MSSLPKKQKLGINAGNRNNSFKIVNNTRNVIAKKTVCKRILVGTYGEVFF